MNLVLFDEASPIQWKQKMLYSNEQLSPMSRLLLNNKNFAMSFPWFRLTFIRNSFNPPLRVFPSCEIFFSFLFSLLFAIFNSAFFHLGVVTLQSHVTEPNSVWNEVRQGIQPAYRLLYGLYVSMYRRCTVLPTCFQFLLLLKFCIVKFYKNKKFRSYLEELGLNFRIILKWVLEKWDRGMD